MFLIFQVNAMTHAPFTTRGARLCLLASATALSLMTASVLAHAGLPALQDSQGVSYLSGGVDLDESTAIKAAMPDYPLVVEVYHQAGGKNEYTASSVLTISTQGAQVFNTTLQGPFALLKLKPGHYDLKVEFEGQVKQSKVDVKSSGSARAVFAF